MGSGTGTGCTLQQMVGGVPWNPTSLGRNGGPVEACGLGPHSGSSLSNQCSRAPSPLTTLRRPRQYPVSAGYVQPLGEAAVTEELVLLAGVRRNE